MLMKKLNFLKGRQEKTLGVWFIRRRIVFLVLGIFFLPLGFKYPNPFLFTSIVLITTGILGIYRYATEKEIIKNIKKSFELIRLKANQ